MTIGTEIDEKLVDVLSHILPFLLLICLFDSLHSKYNDSKAKRFLHSFQMHFLSATVVAAAAAMGKRKKVEKIAFYIYI